MHHMRKMDNRAKFTLCSLKHYTAAGRLILKAKFGRVRPLSRVIQPSFGMRTRYAYLEISV